MDLLLIFIYLFYFVNGYILHQFFSFCMTGGEGGTRRQRKDTAGQAKHKINVAARTRMSLKKKKTPAKDLRLFLAPPAEWIFKIRRGNNNQASSSN